MVRTVKDRIFRIALSRPWLYAVIAANIAGTLFGFYYYGSQLSSSPLHLWPFIPDSPLATLGITVSLLLYLKGQTNSLIDVFGFMANLKYGLWTVAVLLLYFDVFTAKTSDPMYAFLFISHLLMAVQAFLVFDYSTFDLRDIGFVGGWFVLNDLIDYTLNTHSVLSRTGDAPELRAAVSAFGLTLLGIGICLSRIDRDK